MTMLCQGDAVKKGISLKLTIMTKIPLVVAVVMVSIVPNTKKM
jgi:hypothetical protein